MENRLSPEELERIRGIEIHGLLNIKNTGRRVSMRCPFHNERTPSFMLYPDSSYKCFGCGVHGNNIIDFMIEGGMSFGEILKELNLK